MNDFKDKSKQHSGVCLVYSEVTNLHLPLSLGPGTRLLWQSLVGLIFFYHPKVLCWESWKWKTPKLCGLRNTAP